MMQRLIFLCKGNDFLPPEVPNSPVWYYFYLHSVHKVIKEEYISHKGKGREKNRGMREDTQNTLSDLILKSLIPHFYHYI